MWKGGQPNCSHSPWPLLKWATTPDDRQKLGLVVLQDLRSLKRKILYCLSHDVEIPFGRPLSKFCEACYKGQTSALWYLYLLRGAGRGGGEWEDYVSARSECDRCVRAANCQQSVDASTQMPQNADGSELLDPSHVT